VTGELINDGFTKDKRWDCTVVVRDAPIRSLDSISAMLCRYACLNVRRASHDLISVYTSHIIQRT
jgi:hypothetical protein